MPGWLTLAAARASRQRRACASVFDDCERMTLIATSRSSRGSRARYTSPIPPDPRLETISYFPRRLPRLNDMRRRNYRLLSMCSAPELSRYPVVGKVLLGVSENLENRHAVGSVQLAIAIVGHLSAEHLPQSLVNSSLRCGWKAFERFRVNQVAARVLEQASRQIQLTQGSAFSVSRSGSAKPLREGGRSADWSGQWRLVDEEKIVHELFDGRAQGALRIGGSDARFPSKPSDQIQHLRLMLEHE